MTCAEFGGRSVLNAIGGRFILCDWTVVEDPFQAADRAAEENPEYKNR